MISLIHRRYEPCGGEVESIERRLCKNFLPLSRTRRSVKCGASSLGIDHEPVLTPFVICNMLHVIGIICNSTLETLASHIAIHWVLKRCATTTRSESKFWTILARVGTLKPLLQH